ncbi:phage tail protein [Ruminococcaceae bacterium OttesenSCG-928-L11]|nr:phage tail protein [Ruminococcaceae bacterium OttesenSCG-928-L11]
MKQEQKYINFFRHSLMRGCIHGLEQARDMTLSIPDTGGAYLTPVFDTGDEAMTYHRLLVTGQFEELKLEVIVAASNTREVYIEDTPRRLEQYLADPTVAVRSKIEVMTHLPHIRHVNQTDILLHGLTGRYIWVLVAAWSAGGGHGVLEGLRLDFPWASFSEYLPEIYQGNPFFERFLGVFQSLYLDEERKVDKVPMLLDYQSTPDDTVAYLASWLGIDNSGDIFTPEQLRYLIQNIDMFQGGKGTRHALELLIEIATGIQPRIVEYFQWYDEGMSARHMQLYQTLYGDSGNDFCVILNLEGRGLSVDKRDLERLIESYSAIGSRFRVVYLETCNNTDTHCYLDVNSALSIPEIASIDRTSIGDHITVG